MKTKRILRMQLGYYLRGSSFLRLQEHDTINA